MNENKGIAEKTVVVILAAGKGTRMGRRDMAKVCLEIDGVPAITRIMNTFQKKGFHKFIVVVGSKAEQVLDTVGAEQAGVMYVYQEPQLGTGHAAKIAAQGLQNIGFDGNLLITLGDKFLEEQAIENLVDGFIKQQADLAFLTIPKNKLAKGSEGTVILDSDGQAIDIIEKPDLARQAIADELRQRIKKSKSISGSVILKVINSQISNPKKQTAAVPELLALAKKQKSPDKFQLQKILDSKEYNLEIGGKKYTTAQIAKVSKSVNPSLYLFKADAFYRGVGMIDNNNAQGEYYLTDVVKHLAGLKKIRTRTVSIENSKLIQGFNSPDELLAIQDYIRKQKAQKSKTVSASGRPLLRSNQYCTVREWISKIESEKLSLKKWLKRIYGQHEHLHVGKCADLVSVLNCYGKRFGFDEKVCIVRAPGRLNLMGRHVDHRGGFANFLAIDRETIAVAGLRRDNNVIAVNTKPRKFKPVKFNISELIGQFAWSDWVRNMLYSSAGNWGNYIKAAMLRLQHQFNNMKVNGLNIAVTGNVPIAAGLSSSSTIVVAVLQAAIALNNFELTSKQFIDLCGEGEWFVGSRGGAGDHAAIYLGHRGKITQVGYLPFREEKVIDAPKDYQVIIANSHIKAAKSSTAKDLFNARVAGYNLGFALLKQRCPELGQTAEYLRDINPQKLGCSVSDIYRMLMKLPQSMTRKDFEHILSKSHRELMELNFATHQDAGIYNVRGILLFGIAEIVRSRMCMDYLEAGRIEDFGKLMRISHNGDRVAEADVKGTYKAIKQDCSDDYFNRQVANLGTEDPNKVLNAQLYMQPGSYACSTERIDRMVDICCSVAGVGGAQIAGAGLGGCIMIMAKKERVDAVCKALTKHYYKPNKLKPAVFPCITVEGAGLAEF